MRAYTEYLTMNGPSKMAFVNITSQVEEAVRTSGVMEGLSFSPLYSLCALRSATPRYGRHFRQFASDTSTESTSVLSDRRAQPSSVEGCSEGNPQGLLQDVATGTAGRGGRAGRAAAGGFPAPTCAAGVGRGATRSIGCREAPAGRREHTREHHVPSDR